MLGIALIRLDGFIYIIFYKKFILFVIRELWDGEEIKLMLKWFFKNYLDCGFFLFWECFEGSIIEFFELLVIGVGINYIFKFILNFNFILWIWKKKIGWGEFKEDILVYLFILSIYEVVIKK